jgi:hypothetical protein
LTQKGVFVYNFIKKNNYQFNPGKPNDFSGINSVFIST